MMAGITKLRSPYPDGFEVSVLDTMFGKLKNSVHCPEFFS